MRVRLPVEIPNKLRKALQDEVNKQTAENVRNLSRNLQALTLWVVREHLRFGKKRLLRFQQAFLPAIEKLQEFYEAENASETEFYCAYKLKHEVGIDIDELGEMWRIKIGYVEDGDKSG